MEIREGDQNADERTQPQSSTAWRPAWFKGPESAVALPRMFRRAGAALMHRKCFACKRCCSMASRERPHRVSIRRRTHESGRGLRTVAGNWSPGIVSFVMAIRQSIADCDKVFDFLRGDHRYKYELGATGSAASSAHLYPNAPPECARGALTMLFSTGPALAYTADETKTPVQMVRFRLFGNRQLAYSCFINNSLHLVLDVTFVKLYSYK